MTEDVAVVRNQAVKGRGTHPGTYSWREYKPSSIATSSMSMAAAALGSMIKVLVWRRKKDGGE